MATTTDENKIEELRDRYTYATDAWADIREEGEIDMRYMAGDCFALDPDARKAREDANRPIVDADELSQYVNQLINDTRQNKRGVKVTAKGNGANDATAAFRQGKIRDIEYQSNAQQAYAVMAENTFQRSYGFFRIVPRYISDDTDEQELFIEPVPNANQVTPDPDHKRTDGTDLKYLFYEEARTVSEFRREFPDAQIQDFSSHELQQAAGSWVKGQQIRLAEYWTKELLRKRTRFTLKPPAASRENPRPQPIRVFKDELNGHMPSSDQILSSRELVEERVMQYLTNGVEILKSTPWPGKSLPWVTCYGKILFVDGKKVILSLIRLARSPQMLYAYYRTQQAEMAGMIPKVPVIGYKGQFDGLETSWERAPHEPLAFIEANATTPDTGTQILSLPQRLAYEAGSHLQALELCAEGARRAIQSAIGINPMPTAAQRQNEKSGKALERMEATAQKGSFHFTDHYDEGVTRGGAILEELVPHYYDTARETSIRKPDDSPDVVRINTPTGPDGGWAKDDIRTDQGAGAHDVTISIGPAEESEREAASDFANALAQNEQIFPRIADLVVKLKNLGPIGDEIAERLTPPEFRKSKDGQDPLPPAAQQAMAHAQQQVQILGQQLQQAVEAIRTDQVKFEHQLKLEKLKLDAQAHLQLALKSMEMAGKVEAARIVAAKQSADQALEAFEEAIALGREHAHEAGQAERDRQHELDVAAVGQAHALQKTAVDTAAAAGLANQGQAHALEAQALQPPPPTSADGASA